LIPGVCFAVELTCHDIFKQFTTRHSVKKTGPDSHKFLRQFSHLTIIHRTATAYIRTSQTTKCCNFVQWLLSPKFEVEIGRTSPHFWAHVPPLSGSTPPSPSSFVPVLPFLYGPICPFSFPFICTPLHYALSPFPSTFPPPILVPFSSLSRGAPHPARGSSILASQVL